MKRSPDLFVLGILGLSIGWRDGMERVPQWKQSPPRVPGLWWRPNSAGSRERGFASRDAVTDIEFVICPLFSLLALYEIRHCGHFWLVPPHAALLVVLEEETSSSSPGSLVTPKTQFLAAGAPYPQSLVFARPLRLHSRPRTPGFTAGQGPPAGLEALKFTFKHLLAVLL